MLLNYILFLITCLVLGFTLVQVAPKQATLLKQWAVVALFAIHIIAGVGYALFFKQMPNYQQNADTWRMHYSSLQETTWLKEDPKAFFKDVYAPRYTNDGGLFATQNSQLGDLKEVAVIKMLAIFNLVSGGNYYINLVIFSFLVCLGLLQLQAVFLNKLGPKAFAATLVGIWLWPTTLFWTSGLHKEGLLLALTGALLYHLQKMALRKKIIYHWLIVILLAMVFFILRSYSFVFFVGAFIGARIWVAIPWYKNATKIAAVAVVALTVVVCWWLNPILPAEILAQRRSEFLALPANIVLDSSLFEPSFRGMLLFMPKAIYYGMLSPWPGQVSGILSLVAGVENLVFLGLVIWFKFKYWRAKPAPVLGWLVIFCFLYYIFSTLLIGFTIPYLSPILRYKSIIMPLVLVPIVYFSGLTGKLNSVFNRLKI